jgi:hypothetical protein
MRTKVVIDNLLNKEDLLKLIDENGGTDLILSDHMVLYITIPFINNVIENDDEMYAIGTIIVEVKEGILEIPYFSIDDSGLLHLGTKHSNLVGKERLHDIIEEYECDLSMLERLLKRAK